MIRGKCPICGKAFEGPDLDALPAFPFCSDRCRLIDLGRWADGAYQIPGNPAPTAPPDPADGGRRLTGIESALTPRADRVRCPPLGVAGAASRDVDASGRPPIVSSPERFDRLRAGRTDGAEPDTRTRHARPASSQAAPVRRPGLRRVLHVHGWDSPMRILVTGGAGYVGSTARPGPARAGPPGPGPRQPEVRRPRPAALLPEPLLRAPEGRRLRPEGRREGARRRRRDHPPGRDRRLSGLQEGAAARPGDQRRRHPAPPGEAEAGPAVPLRLDRQHLRLDPRLRLQREHPEGPDHPLRRDQGRRPRRWSSTPATASPTGSPPPSASATGCGST